MNIALARRLIHPFQEGQEVVPGVSLESIELSHHAIDYRKDRILLRFSGALVLTISYRSSGRFAFQSRHFNVGISHKDSEFSQQNHAVVRVIKERLQHNDTEEPKNMISPPQATTSVQRRVDFWLLPGHIGHVQDLGFRTLQVLQQVDLLLIEEGGRNSLETIYRSFHLGEPPTVVEITHKDDGLVEHLNAAFRAKKIVALFGNSEGAPGICDPGWRVLKAIDQIDFNPVMQSVSAGSALANALMYWDRPDSLFEFIGLFRQNSGNVPLFSILNAAKINRRTTSFICFAKGDDLCEMWMQLVQTCTGIKGALVLLCNLSTEKERRIRIDCTELHETDPRFLDPSDKVVLRIDIDDWER